MVKLIEKKTLRQTRQNRVKPLIDGQHPQQIDMHNRNMPQLDEQVTTDLAKVFKLLADETRLRILLYLNRSGELHVRALCERLGQSQPAVSHHLALLRVAGLIQARRDGKHNYYHLIGERIHQILDSILADVPAGNRRIRFDNYVLSYAPPVE